VVAKVGSPRCLPPFPLPLQLIPPSRRQLSSSPLRTLPPLRPLPLPTTLQLIPPSRRQLSSCPHRTPRSSPSALAPCRSTLGRIAHPASSLATCATSPASTPRSCMGSPTLRPSSTPRCTSSRPPLLASPSLARPSVADVSLSAQRLVAPPLSSSQAPRRSATLLKSSASSLHHHLLGPAPSPRSAPSSSWSCTITAICTVLVIPPLAPPRLIFTESTFCSIYVDLHHPRSAPASPRSCNPRSAPSSTPALIHPLAPPRLIFNESTSSAIYLVLHHPRSAPSTPRSCNPRSAPSSPCVLHHQLDLHRPLYYTPLLRVRDQAPPRSPRRPRYVSSSTSYRRLLVSC
jgi:hypothetical protein